MFLTTKVPQDSLLVPEVLSDFFQSHFRSARWSMVKGLDHDPWTSGQELPPGYPWAALIFTWDSQLVSKGQPDLKALPPCSPHQPSEQGLFCVKERNILEETVMGTTTFKSDSRRQCRKSQFYLFLTLPAAGQGSHHQSLSHRQQSFFSVCIQFNVLSELLWHWEVLG